MEITFVCTCRSTLRIETPNKSDLPDAVRAVGWHIVSEKPRSGSTYVRLGMEEPLPFARCSERCDRIAARLDALRVKSFETGKYDYDEEARIWKETP